MTNNAVQINQLTVDFVRKQVEYSTVRIVLAAQEYHVLESVW